MPVYMIQAGKIGPVKIGTAGNVAQRLRELQVGNHEKLTLLRLFEGGAAEETRLHERFADNYLRGEWHHFCRAMMGDVGLTEINPKAPSPLPAPIETVTDERRELLLRIMRGDSAAFSESLKDR